jgi:hypothetical protein
MFTTHLFAICGCLAGSVLLSGCAQTTGPELGSVTGRVTMNGKPLENVRVLFWLGHSRPSEGITNSSGRYELRYTVNQDGALLGEHKVRISTAIPRPDDTMAPERVPPAFNSQSDIVREVKRGSNVFDFDISPSGK